jgi:hypothetical protein
VPVLWALPHLQAAFDARDALEQWSLNEHGAAERY